MEAIGVKLDGDGESDCDDSFFDLVFESPHRAAGKQDSRFVGSPRDVLFSNSKETSPVTLLRSTSSSQKFKVFLRFSFRKSSSRSEKTLCAGDSSSKSAEIGESNRLSASITAGDSSLRSQLTKDSSDCDGSPPKTTSSGGAIPKYLKLIKPLYQMVRKRRNEKKGKLTAAASSPPAPESFSPTSSRPGSFKISAKRLVRSRSVSAAVEVPPSEATRRRDDSLLEKHDGIQGAVLYCKNSFNSSSSKEFSKLLRISSDISQEKSGQQGRHSCEVPIRSSF